MDINKVEIAAVQEVEGQTNAVKELNEFELLLVGGGWGDISLG